jgi:uncharacterized membrane protein
MSSIFDIMSRTPSTTDDSPGLSFQEKSLWLTLAANILVYAYYFWRVLAIGDDDPARLGALFGAIVVLLVVLLVAGHVALAIHARPARADQKDERDRRIALHGTRIGYYVLTTGVGATLGVASMSLGTFWTAHAALLSLVLAEISKCAAQLVYYRRGV